MDKVVKYVRVPVKNQKKILEEQQKELMQYAEEKGIHHMTVHNRKVALLKKIKKDPNSVEIFS